MLLGMDMGTLALLLVGALALFLVLDLLAAGGGMSAGMMSGMAGMMGTPWGWGGALLLVLAVVLLLLVGR